MSDRPWVFMGVDRSHFSAKLRPALRYKQIHHVEYPPDGEEIARRTGVGFVPILITPDDETLQDTTSIIDVLEERQPDPPLLPETAADRVLCRLFELYADEFFPIVSMRTRWGYPENEAELRRAFAAFGGSEALGNAVADQMSSYLPMLGITADTIPAIDDHTDEMLALLGAHLTDHPYLLGERLSLADCALMGPLYAHLYLDRVTRAKLYDEAIEVCMWIERCNRPIPAKMGAWSGGTYPDSLRALLELLERDTAPLLTALEAGFSAWAADHGQPGAEPPRGVGEYESELRGVAYRGAVRSYVPWKIQRLRDELSACAAGERDDIMTVLGEGWRPLLESEERGYRLEKRDFKLVLS